MPLTMIVPDHIKARKPRKRNGQVNCVGVNDCPHQIEWRIDGVRWGYRPYFSGWLHMLQRCNDPGSHARRPHYVGVEPCEEWLNFSNFLRWYLANYREGWQLDKDILRPGNKIYGPDTCCLIPPEINTLLNDARLARGEYPKGVCWGTRDQKFVAQVSRGNGAQEFLGYFDLVEDAANAARKAKSAYVVEIALKWCDQIEERIFGALMEMAFWERLGGWNDVHGEWQVARDPSAA